MSAPGAAQPGNCWARPGAMLRPGGPAERRAGTLARLLVTVVCGGYAAGAAVGWGSPVLARVMGDFGLSAAALLAAGSCLWYARTQRGSRFRPAWFLFGVSSAMAGLGNGVWGWYEVVLRQPVPQPSAADFCFLLFAPPAIIGLLVLAKRPVTRAGWVCLALDAWLIGGSLLTLSWSLALAHGSWQGEPVAYAALGLAYPLLDIVLVSMVLALHFRRSSADRPAINTAIGALALTVLCDALFTSPLLRESYRSGHLLDAGWFAGSILLAYAPWVGRVRSLPDPYAAGDRPAAAGPPAPPHSRPISGSLSALTPYLAAAVCTLGVIHTSLVGHAVDRVVLFTGCTVVLALVVRQGIMLLDNITLTQELAQKESHFRSLVQGSSDVIMIAAPSGVLRYVSPAAVGVYGREGDQLVGSELASLIHPEDLARVLHELRRFLAAPPDTEPSTRIECRFRHGRGHWLNVESTVNRYHGGLIFNSRDVTERVRLQAQLQHNASHDPLTDLPNRALFTERVRQALSGRRGADAGAAVLYIDLDGFKAVNDTIGHQAGDELLVAAGHRLRRSVRAGDTAARLGGDEFAALILGDGPPEARGPEEREQRVREIADRLRLTLSEPYGVQGAEARVAASIGIAFAEPGISPATLLRNADLAMYRAKKGGKNRVEVYAPQLQEDVVRQAEAATRLGGALRDGRFALLHQPVVELRGGRITSVAAQARWRSPQGILFTPAEFLRADGAPGGELPAEQVARMGGWLLEEAVEQAARRRQAGLDVPVTVRLSARRFAEGTAGPGQVEALLSRHGLAPEALVLELSVSDPDIPLDELEERLTLLRKLGVGIALDGFGSGGAALAALRRLPLDVLCLDRGLVEGIAESARLRTITAGLLRIAEELGLSSVAEGVDLPEQVSVLRALGCTHALGAAFSGALDEHRLRRALGRGGYPMPGVPVQAGPVTAARAQRSGTPGGQLPVGRVPGGPAGPGVPAGAGGAGAPAGPAPAGPVPAGTAGGSAGSGPVPEHGGAGRPMVAAGALPVRRGGTTGPDAVAHPPLRSHSETSVPPT